jgi:hypothetical protein
VCEVLRELSCSMELAVAQSFFMFSSFFIFFIIFVHQISVVIKLLVFSYNDMNINIFNFWSILKMSDGCEVLRELSCSMELAINFPQYCTVWRPRAHPVRIVDS